MSSRQGHATCPVAIQPNKLTRTDSKMPTRRPTTEIYRCPWAKGDKYIEYHDKEWGLPVHDDRLLFEFLILEGAQAGLSWATILNKRENTDSPPRSSPSTARRSGSPC